MKSILVLALLTLSLNSFADQCAYVTADSAKSAVKLISLSKKNSGGVLELCQNCGQKIATELKVNQIDIGVTGISEVPSIVSVNGEGIDLAYTYVNVSGDVYVNLGKLSNCEVTGASAFITVKKSADGKVKYVPSAIF